MTIAKIAAKIRVAVMVKPNDFSSSFNTLMVVRLAFRELGQLLLRLQARRCGHGSAVRVPGFTLIQFRHASMQESWPGMRQACALSLKDGLACGDRRPIRLGDPPVCIELIRASIDEGDGRRRHRCPRRKRQGSVISPLADSLSSQRARLGTIVCQSHLYFIGIQPPLQTAVMRRKQF